MRAKKANRQQQDSSLVSSSLVSKAVKALLDYDKSKSQNVNSLLGDEKLVQVQFSLDKVPTNPSPKPKPLAIPHAMWKTCEDDPEDTQEPSVCLIVKEESKTSIQELLDDFPKEMGFVKKVLGLDSLRKKHSKYEQQRALLARFDVFMADDRILPMLGKAVGRNFFKAKKQPIPVRLTRKAALPLQILQALRATYWYLSEGTCLTVKAGTTAMSAHQLKENIVSIATQLPEKLPRKWANIRAISVKTTDSTSLPFYNKTPAELLEIAKLAGVDADQVISKKRKKDAIEKQKEEEVEDEIESPKKKQKTKKKSPLLRALEKQQEATKAETKSETKKRKNDNVEKPKVSEKQGKKQKNSKEKSSTGDKLKNTPEKNLKDKVADTNDTRKAKDATPESSSKKKRNKKQKMSDEKESIDDSDTKKDEKSKDKGTPKSEKPKTPETPKIKDTKLESESSKKSKKSAKKKKKSDDKQSNKGDDDTPAKTLESETKTPKGKKEKSTKKVDEKTDEPVTSSGKKRSKSKGKDDGKSKESGPFIASKKFNGSKPGYVFHKGPKGLGYYIDNKPKVDTMMLEALTRSFSSGKRSSSVTKKKKKRSNRRQSW